MHDLERITKHRVLFPSLHTWESQEEKFPSVLQTSVSGALGPPAQWAQEEKVGPLVLPLL